MYTLQHQTGLYKETIEQSINKSSFSLFPLLRIVKFNKIHSLDNVAPKLSHSCCGGYSPKVIGKKIGKNFFLNSFEKFASIFFR